MNIYLLPFTFNLLTFLGCKADKYYKNDGLKVGLKVVFDPFNF